MPDHPPATSSDVRLPFIERIRAVLRISMGRDRWDEIPGLLFERILRLAFRR
jgi:hypothetical protein